MSISVDGCRFVSIERRGSNDTTLAVSDDRR